MVEEIPSDMNKEEVFEACSFIGDCFQLKDVRLPNDFGITMIGLLRGIATIVKENDPELYITICESLSILANK